MTDNEMFGNSEQLDDTISRRAAIKAADSIIERDTSGNNDVVKAMTAWKEYIKGMPPAQPERKKGKWIYHPEIGWGETWLCDQCGEKTTSTVMGKPRANYCPMCGADMRGKQDG